MKFVQCQCHGHVTVFVVAFCFRMAFRLYVIIVSRETILLSKMKETIKKKRKKSAFINWTNKIVVLHPFLIDCTIDFIKWNYVVTPPHTAISWTWNIQYTFNICSFVKCHKWNAPFNENDECQVRIVPSLRESIQFRWS